MQLATSGFLAQYIASLPIVIRPQADCAYVTFATMRARNRLIFYRVDNLLCNAHQQRIAGVATIELVLGVRFPKHGFIPS